MDPFQKYVLQILLKYKSSLKEFTPFATRHSTE